MNGFLNLIKPAGMTSHDAVVWFRKLSGERKTGHLGTLDPMATGVLPLALGSSRKLTEYLIEKDKEYEAEFTFGITTDTGDVTGEVVSRKDCSGLTKDRVLGMLPLLTGEITQVPPMYSAVKVSGRKLYELARRGETVQPKPRKVMVYEFSLVKWREGVSPRATFHLRVGKGTYVRALAQSLGELAGTGATVSRLQRTRAGPFRIQDGYSPEKILQLKRSGKLDEALLPPTKCLPEFPAFPVGPDVIQAVKNGAPLEASLIPGAVRNVLSSSGHPGLFFLMDRNGEVVALMRLEDDRIRYEKVLITS
ncbi:MAG TPA: tRNA pseudouridine(55) synthase TruB [Firmicutes bacterium]|nr:tRNA pseudouridine(55) synthase TruB [Candidatus Fermentithermobacillaceae bacterium]